MVERYKPQVSTDPDGSQFFHVARRIVVRYDKDQGYVVTKKEGAIQPDAIILEDEAIYGIAHDVIIVGDGDMVYVVDIVHNRDEDRIEEVNVAKLTLRELMEMLGLW